MYCTVCIYFRSGFEPLRPRAGPGRGGKNSICSNKKYKNRLLKKTEPNYKPRRNLYDPVDDGLVFVKCSLVKKKYRYNYILSCTCFPISFVNTVKHFCFCMFHHSMVEREVKLCWNSVESSWTQIYSDLGSG